jgi:TRAP-type C4-dicarboxylate transport system substrate-binding protein
MGNKFDLSLGRRQLMMGAGAAGLAAAMPALPGMMGKAFAQRANPWGDPTLAQAFVEGILPEGITTASGDAGPFNMRFSHPAPPVSPAAQAWEGATNGLAAMTDGQVVGEMFPSASLHGYAEGFVAASTGITDFCACYASAEPNAFPADRIFNLPFVMPARADLGTRVVYEMMPYYVEDYRAQGVIFSGKTVLTGSNIMTKSPVRNLDDLQGMRIATGSAPNAEILTALGAVPVTMTFNDYYTSLDSGLVDGLLWNDTFFGAYSIHEVTSYHTRVELVQSGIETCLSPAFLSSVPENVQPALLHWVQMNSMVCSQLGITGSAIRAQEVFEENGVEMIVLSDDERARWAEAVQPVVDAAVEEAEGRGVPAREMIERVAELTAEYEDLTQDEMFQHLAENPYDLT